MMICSRKNRKDNSFAQRGFILIYTVLILSIIAVTASVIINTVLREITISRNDSESLKAFYAADTGLECVRYYQNRYRAFDPMTPAATYSCGLSDFTAGYPAPISECEDHTYQFNITNFTGIGTDPPCAKVTVIVNPRTVVVGGNTFVVCDTQVTAHGYNTCDGGGHVGNVERIRWETM